MARTSRRELFLERLLFLRLLLFVAGGLFGSGVLAEAGIGLLAGDTLVMPLLQVIGGVVRSTRRGALLPQRGVLGTQFLDDLALALVPAEVSLAGREVGIELASVFGPLLGIFRNIVGLRHLGEVGRRRRLDRRAGRAARRGAGRGR